MATHFDSEQEEEDYIRKVIKTATIWLLLSWRAKDGKEMASDLEEICGKNISKEEREFLDYWWGIYNDILWAEGVMTMTGMMLEEVSKSVEQKISENL